MKVLHELDGNELMEIRDIQETQKKLHLPISPLAFIDLEVLNNNGVIKQKYSDRSKSWVRNMYNFITGVHLGVGPGNMGGTTYGEGTLVMRSITGSNINTANSSVISARDSQTGVNRFRHFRGDTGSVTMGIVLGSSDKEEDFDDFKLDTLIGHGSGSGQLVYNSMPSMVPLWSSLERKMICHVTRVFTNSSGGLVSVKEMGIYCSVYTGIANQTIQSQIMISRDKLSSIVEVGSGETLNVRYSIEIPFPG